MKPNFNRAEHIARILRLLQPNNSIALDVKTMTFNLPIIIDTFQNYAYLTNTPIEKLRLSTGFQDGYTVTNGDTFIILYDDKCAFGEKHINWTLAHEVGHIYLGHETDEQLQEIEAHWFAAELLSPELIIREIVKSRRLNSFDLQELFNISFEAAQKRVDSLNRKTCWDIRFKDELLSKYHTSISTYIHPIQNKKLSSETSSGLKH